MPVTRIEAAACGYPAFDFAGPEDGGAFALSSHARAREALEFGLSSRDPGFNIFVIGEDNSGRMTMTLEFLEQAMARRKPANDWVYLANFRRPHRPKPYRLPAGVGRRFRDRMAALIPQLRRALVDAFGDDGHQRQLRDAGEAMQAEVSQRLDTLRAEAQRHGLDLVQTPQGPRIVSAAAAGEAAPPGESAAAIQLAAAQLAGTLVEVLRWAVQRQGELTEWVGELERKIADQALSTLLDAVVAEFGEYGGLGRWLTEARVDMLDNHIRFRPQAPGETTAASEPPERRYAVNLLVDHADDAHPSVVLEANPTYENLFGRIDYRQEAGSLHTDFTLIRAGALHRASGGVLVLRADALAADKTVWEFLKGAMRDRAIRIEEPHRAGTPPIAGAPRPKSIPLEAKIVLVGAPRWYGAFFSVDPDFQAYFKVKADIDPDLAANPLNLSCYAGLLRRMAQAHGAAAIEDAAMQRLLGIAARWAQRRDKLTARFEQLDDILSEAALLIGKAGPRIVTAAAVRDALANRRRRNARAEDRMQEAIADGLIGIDTAGGVIGQVNALTVRDAGDYVFGTPARVTARASIGRLGVVNIEREIALGGPIQQKGVMVLQGFLAGRFARRLPMSFNCSITFEQSYGGVEGDSASLAELLAIISDLAGVPLRQDLAITGSVDQRGEAQAVGGVHHKVEGFFRTCAEKSGLTGTQGVAIPAANTKNLVVRDEVSEAIAAGRFHVYAVDSFDDALALFTGLDPGEPTADGDYPPGSVYARVMAQLVEFDRILAARRGS